MKLSLDNLAVHLKQAVARSQLAPAYLVSGDEDLLVGEACDAIRAAARELGYTEREVNFPERSGDWADIAASLSSMSLFGDRRIVEIRFSGKAGKEGGAALQKILESAGPDTLLLIVTPRLEFATQNTAWVKAIESTGAWLPIWEARTDSGCRRVTGVASRGQLARGETGNRKTKAPRARRSSRCDGGARGRGVECTLRRLRARRSRCCRRCLARAAHFVRPAWRRHRTDSGALVDHA
jgi:hypothetical protein